jgi:hypothetical protein
MSAITTKHSKKIITIALSLIVSIAYINLANGTSFLNFNISVTDTSGKVDLETLNQIPLNTDAIVNVRYVGSGYNAYVQVNITHSLSSKGPWTTETAIPYQSIANKTNISHPYTFNQSGYYRLTMYTQVDQSSKIYELPIFETQSVAETPEYPQIIAVFCLLIGVIGAVLITKMRAKSKIAYSVNRCQI